MNKTAIKEPILILTLLFMVFTMFGKGHFEWTPLAKKAYQKTLSLRFTEAKAHLAKLKLEDPENLIAYHIEDYIDFFRVYINEDKAEFERLEANKDERLKKIKDNGDKNAPYYRYLQADIRLHWALARLKFEEYTTAFFEVNKAFKLLSENAKAFPNFMPNKKDLGILHAMVGTIPDNYKWAVEWLSSMEGSIDQGRGELEEVIEYASHNDFIYEEETYVLYAYLLLHLGNDQEEAWRIINTSNLNPETSPMACFILANLAMRTDQGDKAIQLLEARPQGRTFHPFPYLEYMLGIAKLQRLDRDANEYLQYFVQQFSGRNFIKDAYQKLAWYYLINGNIAQYNFYIKNCKSKGYTIVGNDKSALKEAETGQQPNIKLLKARLLFDGGYFKRAYELLKTKTSIDFTSKKDQLECNYRLGRITHKLNKNSEALSYYQKTIDQGRNQSWYFACRAALEIGKIYESQSKFQQAKDAFENCLTIKPDEHKTALHQQAKAGLSRLKGKLR